MDAQHFQPVPHQRHGFATVCRDCSNQKQRARRRARAAILPPRPPSATQKLLAQGLKRCTQCGEVKPATTEYFFAAKREAGGVRSVCKPCVNQQQRARRASGGGRRWPKKDRQREVFDAWRSAGCVVCGMKLVKAIDAHHLDPREKDYNIARALGQMTDEELHAELAKCVPICRNDHALVGLELRAGGDSVPFDELVHLVRDKYGITYAAG